MKLGVLAMLLAVSALGQVVITDSGSTNRPGMNVTLDEKGNATIEARQGAKATMAVPSDLHSRLMRDLEAAAPVDQLKAHHCAKSVSFGSSMYVTYKGVRSPDLSCGGQTDPNVIALQKDMQEIINQAKTKMPTEPRFR